MSQQKSLISLPGFDLFPPVSVYAFPEKKSLQQGAAGRLWNQYGAALETCAFMLDCGLDAVIAVFLTEAGALAFDPRTELCIIRVEARPPLLPVIRFRNEKIFTSKFGSGQDAEWRALKAWMETEPDRALNYTSFGLPQIMGFNHRAAGYESAEAMLFDFQSGAISQIMAFAHFIKNNGSLLKALKNHDWPAFARHYNGPGQVDRYAKTLSRNLNTAKSLLGQLVGKDV